VGVGHIGDNLATPIRSARTDDALAGIREAFAAAGANAPSQRHEIFLELCARPVRLRVAGNELAAQLTRCFGNLVDRTAAGSGVRDAKFSLTIHAWDRAATDVGCPGIPIAPDRTDELGSGLLAQFFGGRLLRYDKAAMVKLFDRSSHEMFICVEDAQRTTLSERSKPFPHFLAAWCHDLGIEVLHGGLVSRNGRGILLGGGSGSGKSTSSITAALAGFDFLGDDCAGVELTEIACIGHALYDAVRADEGTLERLPALRRHSRPFREPRDGNKYLVYMSDVIPGRTVAATTIAAIVVPRIVGSGRSRILAASRGSTLRKLAPSTLLRGLGTRADGLARIAELVRRVPCYELEIGANLHDVPQLLDDTLSAAVS
jgi:hypothetical protein